MALLAVWRCENPACELETLMPQALLEMMTLRTVTGERYLHFVCPHCGTAQRRSISALRTQEINDLPADAGLLHPTVVHIAVRCEQAMCATQATLHTLAKSAAHHAELVLPVSKWNVAGLRCPEGHPVKAPVEVISIRVHEV